MKINLNDSFQVTAAIREIRRGAELNTDLETVSTWKSSFFGTLFSRIVSVLCRRTQANTKIQHVFCAIIDEMDQAKNIESILNGQRLLSALRDNVKDQKTKIECNNSLGFVHDYITQIAEKVWSVTEIIKNLETSEITDGDPEAWEKFFVDKFNEIEELSKSDPVVANFVRKNIKGDKAFAKGLEISDLIKQKKKIELENQKKLELENQKKLEEKKKKEIKLENQKELEKENKKESVSYITSFIGNAVKNIKNLLTGTPEQKNKKNKKSSKKLVEFDKGKKFPIYVGEFNKKQKSEEIFLNVLGESRAFIVES